MKDLNGNGNLKGRTDSASQAYKVLQNYDLAFDIGTNVGGFSNAYHNKFNKIVAIEAHPLTYILAKQNLSPYSNVEVINKAVSNVDNEEVALYLHDNDDSGSTSLIKLPSNSSLDEVHTVNTISYPSLIAKYGIPQYMKIDCEGGEYNFLINQDLSGVEFIAIEIHYAFLTELHQQELLEYLLQDFQIHSMKEGKYGFYHPEYNFIRK
jgi:FkbM family methyltransferase